MDAPNGSRAEQVSRVTQAMHDFHKEAWDRLDILEANAQKLKSAEATGSAATVKEVDSVISFIESDMWPHFKQEEEQVYSVLKKTLPPNRRRSVVAMEKEHRTIGRQVADIRRLLRGDASAETNRQLADACLRLARQMRNHINKENLAYQEFRDGG